MISYTQQRTIFGDLSQNTVAANLTRGSYLANIEHRYLLQKYFNNEASYTITTVGSKTLTLTTAPVVGAISATLSYAWKDSSCSTTVTFSDGESRTVKFIYNSTAITWTNALVGTTFSLTAGPSAGDTTATLDSVWAHTSGTYTVNFPNGEQKTATLTNGSTAMTWTVALTADTTASFQTSICTDTIGVGGVQEYILPPDYSKLKTETITIGSLKWTPTEVLTREEWDKLNVFPYYADIPSRFFIWNGKFQLWPIPATSGNIITFNYKRRIPDLSIADYSTGTVTATNGSTTITGSGATFMATTNGVTESRWIQITPTTSAATSGDNLWYEVASVDSTSVITLKSPYQGVTVTGASYVLGQMPLLPEDFHDLLVWKPLIFYYTSIVDNPTKKEEYQGLYEEKIKMLDEYAGSKTINVNLGRRSFNRNPNLYWQG